MITINWFALTIIAIWICGAIGTAASKRNCFMSCFWITLAMGIGYYFLHGGQ